MGERARRGAVERTSLYQLLGRAKDEALARRALDLALTNEPGKTISAGMITAVAGGHPRLAIDFVLSHLAQVNQLIDISGRSRFMQRLAAGSRDPALIPMLEGYAKANLPTSDRKPIQQAIDRIRFEVLAAQRIRSESRMAGGRPAVGVPAGRRAKGLIGRRISAIGAPSHRPWALAGAAVRDSWPEVRLLICSLDGDRNHSEAACRFRRALHLRRHRSQAPRTLSARALAPGFC